MLLDYGTAQVSKNFKEPISVEWAWLLRDTGMTLVPESGRISSMNLTKLRYNHASILSSRLETIAID